MKHFDTAQFAACQVWNIEYELHDKPEFYKFLIGKETLDRFDLG